MSVRDGLGFNNCCGKTQPTGVAKLSGLWKRGEHEPGKGAFMLLGLFVLHCGCDVTYFLVIWPPCCYGLWAIVHTVPVIYYSHKLTSMRIIHVCTWLKVKLEENQEIRDSSCFCSVSPEPATFKSLLILRYLFLYFQLICLYCFFMFSPTY